MKKFLIAATALSGLLAFAGSASAADLAVPVDPVYDWTGFYVGAQGGYAWGDSRAADFLAGGVLDRFADLDPDGWFGGLHAGYNFQTSGNLVFGLEGDINLADIDSGTQSSTDALGVLDPLNTFRGEMDWFGSARVRAGFAMDRFLPYVTGGVAFGGYEMFADFVGDDARLDETMIGWTVGGGLEYAFTEMFTARVEYRYTDYGSQSDNGFALFPGETQKVDLTTSDVRLGVTWKF